MTRALRRTDAAFMERMMLLAGFPPDQKLPRGGRGHDGAVLALVSRRSNGLLFGKAREVYTGERMAIDRELRDSRRRPAAHLDPAPRTSPSASSTRPTRSVRTTASSHKDLPCAPD